MDYGQLGLLLIAVVAALLGGLLVPYIRANTTKVQRDNIQMLIQIAVFAVEQIYNSPHMGKIKKEAVIQYLASKGIKLLPEDLDILIEAAVLELNLVYDEVFE